MDITQLNGSLQRDARGCHFSVRQVDIECDKFAGNKCTSTTIQSANTRLTSSLQFDAASFGGLHPLPLQ